MMEIQKHKVVIVGGNFAGISALKELNRKHRTDLDITVIDPEPHFTWTPNIHEILSGTKNEESVEITREKLVTSLGANYLKGAVKALDSISKTLLLNDGDSLSYDACILCCGNKALKPDNVQGFTFKNAADVALIKQSLGEQLASKDSVAVTIIGGGFSGVEALGELLRHYRHNRKIELTVIDSGSRLLKSQPAVVATDISQICEEYDVEFIFEQRVQNSANNTLTLTNGTHLHSDITIWTVGSTLSDFLNTSSGMSTEERIKIDGTLQLTDSAGVFMAGDAAPFSWENHLLPKQSYYAQDMGQIAARNVMCLLENHPLATFKPSPKPVLIAFGDLNTYMVSGNLVLASPSLAATKEALYQLGMFKLMASFPLHMRKKAALSRLLNSTKSLLLPQLNLSLPSKLLLRSRILQRGKLKDLNVLMRSAYATLLP